MRVSLSFLPQKVIQALVAASGRLGLDSFLPSSDRKTPGDALSDPEEVPHLPLNARWEDADFRIESVMSKAQGMSVREWTLRLLERYRFAIGEWCDLRITREGKKRVAGG